MEEGLWVPTSFSSPHFEKLSQPLPQGPLWEERGVGLEGPRVFSAFRLPLLAQVCSTLLPTAFFAMSCSRFWFAASFCQALFLVVAFLVCAPYIIAVFTLILLATWFVAVHLSVSCPPLSLLGLHGRVNTMCGGNRCCGWLMSLVLVFVALPLAVMSWIGAFSMQRLILFFFPTSESTMVCPVHIFLSSWNPNFWRNVVGVMGAGSFVCCATPCVLSVSPCLFLFSRPSDVVRGGAAAGKTPARGSACFVRCNVVRARAAMAHCAWSWMRMRDRDCVLGVGTLTTE